MTRPDLERRLAEHFEPMPETDPDYMTADSPGGFWLPAFMGNTGGPENVGELYGWTHLELTRDGNAMLALVRAASAAGYWVNICTSRGGSGDADCGLTEGDHVETTAMEFQSTDQIPLAVAIAIARAVGILVAEEEVTDG